MNIEEVAEQALRTRERLAQEIVFENGCIVFKCANDYWIDLKRINSAGKLLGWIRHLASKPWMTPERLKFFIDAVADKKKIRVARTL